VISEGVRRSAGLRTGISNIRRIGHSGGQSGEGTGNFGQIETPHGIGSRGAFAVFESFKLIRTDDSCIGFMQEQQSTGNLNLLSLRHRSDHSVVERMFEVGKPRGSAKQSRRVSQSAA